MTTRRSPRDVVSDPASDDVPVERDERDRALAARRWLDVSGLVIAAALCGWILVSAAARGGTPVPQIGLLLVCTAALIAARFATSLKRWIAPLAVLASAIGVAAVSGDGILSTRPLEGPFGYANAKSGFAAMAAVAGLMLWHAGGWPRVLGLLGAIAAGIVPFASDSTVASAVVIGAIIIALVGYWRPIVRPAIVLCAASFFVILGATVYVGATHVDTDTPDERGSIVSREALWHDAIEEVRGDPLVGVGPGRFSEFSPTSMSDPDDAHWAHQAFLQQAAETGIVGGGLLVALFVWAFVRLLVVDRPDAVTALAGFVVAALGVMSCVDYVMHFPAIPIAASALVGTGMMSGRSRSRSTARITEGP